MDFIIQKMQMLCSNNQIMTVHYFNFNQHTLNQFKILSIFKTKEIIHNLKSLSIFSAFKKCKSLTIKI